MFKLTEKLPPSLVALLLQLLSFILALLYLRFIGRVAEPMTIALLSGFLAATSGYLVGLARWWLPILFLFAPALVLMLKLNIPSGIYLGAFLLMLLVYWSTYRSQVPLYLSSKRVWQTMEELLPPPEQGKYFSFIDIGCGTGGILTHLAAIRPDGHYFGVENAPLPYALSRMRIKLGKHANCHVQWGSMWESDLSLYDVVYAYLSPVPMAQLWEKASSEMRPGTLFVSNTFVVPQHPPQYSITLDDMQRSTLYIWHM